MRKETPQERYDKANTKAFTMKLNMKTDADILNWLKSQTNKQGKIKALIRNEINKS